MRGREISQGVRFAPGPFFFAALVLLSGCATLRPSQPPIDFTHPDCTTKCGARVWFRNGAAPIACEQLELGESVAFAALKHHTQVDLPALCARLRGWQIQIGPTGYATECTARLTWLQAYEYGGHTHELLHVADNCWAYQERHTGPFAGLLDWIAPNPVDFHRGWKTNGNQAAIDEADVAWRER